MRLKLRHEQYRRAQEGRQRREQQQQQQQPYLHHPHHEQHTEDSYSPHHPHSPYEREEQEQELDKHKPNKRSWRDELREESEDEYLPEDDSKPWYQHSSSGGDGSSSSKKGSGGDKSFFGGNYSGGDKAKQPQPYKSNSKDDSIHSKHSTQHSGQQDMQKSGAGDPLTDLLPHDPLQTLLPKDPLATLLPGQQKPGSAGGSSNDEPPSSGYAKDGGPDDDSYSSHDSSSRDKVPDVLENLRKQLLAPPKQQTGGDNKNVPGRRERPTIPPSKRQQQQQPGGGSDLLKGLLPPGKQQQEQQERDADAIKDLVKDKLQEGLLPGGKQNQQQQDPLKNLASPHDPLKDLASPRDPLQDLASPPDALSDLKDQLLSGHGQRKGSSSIVPGDTSGNFWGDSSSAAGGRRQQQRQQEVDEDGQEERQAPAPHKQPHNSGSSANSIFGGGSSQAPRWALGAGDEEAPARKREADQDGDDATSFEPEETLDFFAGGGVKPPPSKGGGKRNDFDQPWNDDRREEPSMWEPEDQEDWELERQPEERPRKRAAREQQQEQVRKPDWGQRVSVPKWAQQVVPGEARLAADSVGDGQQLQQQQQLQGVGNPEVEEIDAAAFPACSDATQILQCGQLPVETAAEQEAHSACCRMFAPRRIPSELLPPPAEKVECDRWDLDEGGPLSQPLDWHFAHKPVKGAKPSEACTAKATAAIPSFADDRVSDESRLQGCLWGEAPQLAQMQECWLWQEPRAAGMRSPALQAQSQLSVHVRSAVSLTSRPPACLSSCLLASPPPPPSQNSHTHSSLSQLLTRTYQI